LLIALVTAFLPIGSTLAISRLLMLALNGIAYLASLVFTFFSGLVASVLVLLTQNIEQQPPPPAAIPTPAPPPVTPPPAAPDPFITMMISSAFWALLIAIIIGSLLFFLRERGYQVDRARINETRTTVIMWLRELWARLTGGLRGARRKLRRRIQEFAPQAPVHADISLPRPRFFRLNSLSPREQVRYYYLALVRRAGERGVNRGHNETPLEYIQELRSEWPDAEEDLRGLTEGFLEARYGREPIEKSAVNPIKERWKRLKDRLRRPRVAE
jgi:hypothetical protein